MSLRPSFPDTVPGTGFVYIHEPTKSYFQSHTTGGLWRKVEEFATIHGFPLTIDEFDDNICRNTPNIVCTEGLRGLGDAIHVVLNPIAKLIDSVAGTDLVNCGGCKGRQEALNNL